jgi:hypothetical protein
MRQSAWEAKGHSASQKTHILWKPSDSFSQPGTGPCAEQG